MKKSQILKLIGRSVLTILAIMFYAAFSLKQEINFYSLSWAFVVTLIFYSIIDYYNRRTDEKNLTAVQRAADDLLKACKLSLDLWDSDSRSVDPEEIVDYLKEVIAKAQNEIYYEGIAKATGFKVYKTTVITGRSSSGAQWGEPRFFWLPISQVEERLEHETEYATELKKQTGRSTWGDGEDREKAIAWLICFEQDLPLFATAEAAWQDCCIKKGFLTETKEASDEL